MPWASAATAPRPRCASKPTRCTLGRQPCPGCAVVPLGTAGVGLHPGQPGAGLRPASCRLGRGPEATSAAFEHLAAQAHDSAECALDIAALPTGHYAWRTASVRWVDGQRDQGPFGAVQAFSVQAPPAQPADIETETRQGHTTLYWAGSPASATVVQALASPQAHEPALDIWLDTAQWTVAGLPAGTWHIRLQAQDANGLLSSLPPRA